ncbi:MAG: alpha/beta hydrolase [Pseudomonadota bacterium]
MSFNRIEDWDAAYENRAFTPGFETYPPKWQAAAAAHREAAHAAGRARLAEPYGPDPRQAYDLFLPAGTPAGLVVIVHGGYWRSLGREDFSHLAAGPAAHGYAVAMPSYRLAPAVSVAEITSDVATVITAAARSVAGPILLAGHSAGGHLVTRMLCAPGPLPGAVAGRIVHVLSVSGLHDLRPLVETDKNADLRLDPASAAAESPALARPRPATRLTAWVGGAERPEFIRQSELIANMWLGLGAETRLVIEPERNHFSVIESLAEPEGALTAALLAGRAPAEGALQ